MKYKLIGIAFLLSLITYCARLPIVRAIESRPWPTTAQPKELQRVVNEADGFILGIVEKTFEDRKYDDVCGLFAGWLGKCNETHTYRLKIRGANEPIFLWVFVPRGDTLVVPVGTSAVFIWEMKWIKQLGVCAERLRLGIWPICESDELPVVLSLDNVAAPSDYELIAYLFSQKRYNK